MLSLQCNATIYTASFFPTAALPRALITAGPRVSRLTNHFRFIHRFFVVLVGELINFLPWSRDSSFQSPWWGSYTMVLGNSSYRLFQSPGYMINVIKCQRPLHRIERELTNAAGGKLSHMQFGLFYAEYFQHNGFFQSFGS